MPTFLFLSESQGRSQRGAWVHAPRQRRSVFVTAPLVFSRVPIFCLWTPLDPWFVPLSKFLATPLLKDLVQVVISRVEM